MKTRCVGLTPPISIGWNSLVAPSGADIVNAVNAFDKRKELSAVDEGESTKPTEPGYVSLLTIMKECSVSCV